MKPLLGRQGLFDGLMDSREEFGGALVWSAMEAEGDISLLGDLEWLDREGFLK